MKAFARILALGALVLAAAPLAAQSPMRPMPGGPGEGGVAAAGGPELVGPGELARDVTLDQAPCPHVGRPLVRWLTR